MDAADNSNPSDKIKRRAYLSTKGIGQNTFLQMDLLFPVIKSRDDQRFIPNEYARSSLFTTRNKTQPRRSMTREKLFHLNPNISVLYTGAELRAEDDEIIWLQILHYGKRTEIGKPYEFLLKDLVNDVGWSKSGGNYERARNCISRLRANEVLVLNDKAFGRSGSMSLISEYESINNEEGKQSLFRVLINPNILVLFAGNTFASLHWDKYRDLTPIARRLADYIESHKEPFPLDLEKFKSMCGSTTIEMRSWKQNCKTACQEIEQKGIAKRAWVEAEKIFIIPNEYARSVDKP